MDREPSRDMVETSIAYLIKAIMEKSGMNTPDLPGSREAMKQMDLVNQSWEDLATTLTLAVVDYMRLYAKYDD